MPDCLSSAFSLVALSLVAFPITASSVVFLSGTSSADQLFLSFPTFNGYFELTTAARNLNVIGPQKKKIIIRPRSTLFWQ
jgi:hypothetical protein